MTVYRECLKFLSDLEVHGIKLGLDQVSELFRRAGIPHNSLVFIHVAGTNGKGSVCAMLAECLKKAGFKTGFYSSPHLVTARERFRINGKAIPEKQFARIVSKLRPSVEKMRSEGRCPTYFEVTTLIAAKYFSENKTDFVVWETGMGGRFDATNIVTPTVSVITGIGIDHVPHLGGTEEEIAFEKAGIIKSMIPVFCGEMSREAMKVISQKAEKESTKIYKEANNCKIIRCSELKGKSFRKQLIRKGKIDFELSLPGDIQCRNASLAFEVLKYLSKKHDFDFNSAVRGFSSVHWPGRFQLLSDGSIVDGAHNPQAISLLVKTAKSLFPKEKFSIIFGCLADKDSGTMVEELAKIAEEFIFVTVEGSRKSVASSELAEKWRSELDIPVFSAKSVPLALKMKHGKRFLITGSLYLAGQVLKEYFTENEISDI